MKEGCKKYIPFKPVELKSRTWPCNKIEHAPIWCSVDLRDGNQALIDPMNLPEKLEMFKTLCAIGIKEIEVGFPSASETEYEFLRTLIDNNMIPEAQNGALSAEKPCDEIKLENADEAPVDAADNG